MGKRLKILNYAVNGSGLGHVTRLVAINRWLERLAIACGVQPEIYFLTTSEADSLVWRSGFASFKIPSKNAIKDGRISIEDYLRLARQWVWNALNLLHPDILIVDTFPNGSFGELVNALDLARHRVFVHREMKPELARRPSFQAMLPLYDQILVPHLASDVRLVLPAEARSSVFYAGPILVRDREELLDREDARARLGVPADRLAVYLSAGGGGDDTAEGTLNGLLEALEPDPDLHLVVGAGPLYRGVPRRGPRITWLAECDTVELLSGIDLAVSAAGYNSFSELMYLGVPALFFAQEKVADVQAERLARAVRAGAAGELEWPLEAGAVQKAIAALKEPSARIAMAEAARALVPGNGARAAAAQVLAAVTPPEDVEEALEAVTADFLAGLRRLQLSLDTGVQALRLLGDGGIRSERRRWRLEVADALSSGEPGPALRRRLERRFPDDLDGRALGDKVLSRLERWSAAGVPPAEGLKLLEQLLKRTRLVRRGEAPRELGAAIDALIEALAAFGDWRGAGVFVSALAGRGDDWLEALRRAVDQLQEGRARGMSVYEVLAASGGGR